MIAKNSGQDTFSDFQVAQGEKIGLSGLSCRDFRFSNNQIPFGTNVLVTFSNGLNAASIPQINFVPA